MTLKEACSVVFKGAISPATLKAEASRGNLMIRKIGRAYFVTWRDLNAMWEKCSVAVSANRPNAVHVDVKAALAGALANAALLKFKHSLRKRADRLK